MGNITLTTGEIFDLTGEVRPVRIKKFLDNNGIKYFYDGKGNIKVSRIIAEEFMTGKPLKHKNDSDWNPPFMKSSAS